MAKHSALFAYIELDNVSFSNGQVREVGFTSSDAQIDAGGFNADGDTEFLSGQRTKQVTMTFYMDRASGAVNQVLYPLHRDKTIFHLVYRENQNNAVGATNPELRGAVRLPEWAESATFGDVETLTLTFVSDISDPLEKYET